MKKKAKIKISEERHCHELESLGSIFIPIMNGAFDAKDFIEVDVMLKWEDIIGKEIALFSTPTKVKFNPKTDERVIYIDVPVGGFALELQHREIYLLDKINSYFGYKAIHKLQISQNVNMRIKKIQPMKKKPLLTDGDKKYLSDMSDGIKNDELKEILIKLGENVISSKKGDIEDNGNN